ncbi:MAG: cardiolipin synthase [Bacteroidaceae bacterium]|nr:cardiolipin synthase [Bacteroidaceae bacterium]
MFDWSSPFSILFHIVYLTMVLGTVVVVILDNRYPVKTLAWLMVLIFLPVLGLILYFFFGQSVRKERLISKRSYIHIARKPLRGYWRKPPHDLPDECQSLASLFRRMNRSMPFGGNQVEIFTDGVSKFDSLLQCISQARHHIHLEYFIFDDDQVGNRVADALIRKAHEGVKVRVMYDDVGCWQVKSSFFHRMRQAGIEVHPFLKVRFPIFGRRVNFRNHRKIAIIDGVVGFIGGMNIADRYLHGLSWGVFRDTSIRIQGMAVQGLQTVFLMDWCFVTGEQITNDSYFPLQEEQGRSQMQIVTSKPVGRWREIMQGYLHAIANARRYIYIQSPYFLPTEQILTALQTAALLGVDVRIMLPWKGDIRVVQMCSRSYLRDVMEAGVKVLFYQPGFLHAKTMVIDDLISTVGSTNIDFRSFEYNFEVNAFMYDTDTAIRLRHIFQADEEQCTHISSQRWARRSWWRKVEESILRLFAPLM